jgi:hypothetical protein
VPIVPPASHPSPGVFRRLGAAGPVAIVLSFWPPLGGFLLLTTLTTFAPWLRENPAPGLVIYFFATTLLVGFSFLPTFAVALYAGWTFGFGLGFSIALAARGYWVSRPPFSPGIGEGPAGLRGAAERRRRPRRRRMLPGVSPPRKVTAATRSAGWGRGPSRVCRSDPTP